MKLYTSDPPSDAIQFRGTLHHLLTYIVAADPAYEFIYMDKVNLSSAHTNVCICDEDITQLSFFIPFHHSKPETLIKFNLTLQMDYVDPT